MFQGWRFQLRDAAEALAQGQLDVSCRLLTEGNLRQYLPGRRLSAKVAAQLANRACRRVFQGDLLAGWRDLRAAIGLAGEIEAVLSARQQAVAVTVREAEGYLGRDDPSRAMQLLEELERYEVRAEALESTKEVARRLVSARNLARRGKFADAADQARAVGKMHAKYGFAVEKAKDYQSSIEPFRTQIEALHRAVAGGQWTEAVSLADQALAMAPDNQVARDVRRRAWAQVGTPLADSRLRQTVGRVRAGGTAASSEREAGSVTMVEQETGPRYLLWIDGVGGYLVCLADEVIVGQANPENRIAVPIQADLSGQQAKIHRRGGDYVIEPFHLTVVNGQRVRGKTLLSDGDDIRMASDVRLRFRQPHALSASARLDFASRHRTLPRADGILLMAESCVLGPKRQNHVVCCDWQNDVVLYRRDGELYCRAMDSIEIDGRVCDGRARLGLNSHVSGSDFSMSLEELS